MKTLTKENSFFLFKFSRMVKVSFCAIISFIFILYPTIALAEDTISYSKEEFQVTLEKDLVKNMNYYDPHSMKIEKSIMIDGHVKKVSSDGIVEEYDSPIVAALVKVHHRRDSIFLFNKTEIYFFASKKGELLDYSSVSGNTEISDFYKKYSSEVGSGITPLSYTILLLMVSTVLIVPILVIYFHNRMRER